MFNLDGYIFGDKETISINKKVSFVRNNKKFSFINFFKRTLMKENNNKNNLLSSLSFFTLTLNTNRILNYFNIGTKIVTLNTG
jgi:thioredoxin-related protein